MIEVWEYINTSKGWCKVLSTEVNKFLGKDNLVSICLAYNYLELCK